MYADNLMRLIDIVTVYINDLLLQIYQIHVLMYGFSIFFASSITKWTIAFSVFF